jgi:hypothetical protein
MEPARGALAVIEEMKANYGRRLMHLRAIGHEMSSRFARKIWRTLRNL